METFEFRPISLPYDSEITLEGDQQIMVTTSYSSSHLYLHLKKFKKTKNDPIKITRVVKLQLESLNLKQFDSSHVI